MQASKAFSQKGAGPLSEYISGFHSKLLAQGYSPASLKTKFHVVFNFNKWLVTRDIKPCKISENVIKKFFKERPRSGHIRRGDSATLNTLLKYLRDSGIASKKIDRIVHDDIQKIMHNYAEYLEKERGLAPTTLDNYLPIIFSFLKERFGKNPLLLNEIILLDVTRFVLGYSRLWKPKRSQLMTSALRSFFRYLRFHGDITLDLAEAVPTVASWRLPELPKSLAREDIDRLLQSCDQNTAVGQRDYTVLLILSRLGLRSCEIVNMTLDDIDWENGVMTIHGKGVQHNQMPIPYDLGEALSRYICKSRPPCATRRLFIRARAPLQGFSGSAAVDDIVRRALKRSGVKSLRQGAYLLRHSLACSMLQQGNSLMEIGEILRHSSINTTEIYAKVNINALAAIAQPWLGGNL